jgi:pSer/pThr/pTyr-binding forkhead associated (FHA) protein
MAEPWLEVRTPEGVRTATLGGTRVSVGKAEANDLALAWDPTVSKTHAVLERYTGGWAVRDLSSTNGTFVNGQRIWGERPLQPGDEVRLGSTVIVYRASTPTRAESTVTVDPPPLVTAREREVLIALCRPLISADVFTEPASIARMAEELCVSAAAVKQHLTNLYAKFGVPDGDGRRARLANAAMSRRAISVGDLS